MDSNIFDWNNMHALEYMSLFTSLLSITSVFHYEDTFSTGGDKVKRSNVRHVLQIKDSSN